MIPQKFIPPDIDYNELPPRELDLLEALERLTDMVNHRQEPLHGLEQVSPDCAKPAGQA